MNPKFELYEIIEKDARNSIIYENFFIIFEKEKSKLDLAYFYFGSFLLFFCRKSNFIEDKKANYYKKISN